jgi:hypothetical protein
MFLPFYVLAAYGVSLSMALKVNGIKAAAQQPKDTRIIRYRVSRYVLSKRREEYITNFIKF